MILFYLLNFTLTLAKLLANSFLSDDKIFFKIFLIPIMGVICYILFNNYKAKLYKTLVQTISYYKIHNKFDLAFSVFIMLSYLFIFVFGIFYMRYINIGRMLDLKVIYYKILQYPYYINIINLIFVISLLLLYIFVIGTFLQAVQRHFVKLHIYFQDRFRYSFYKAILKFIVITYSKFYTKVSYLYKICYEKLRKQKISSDLVEERKLVEKRTDFILSKIHYVIFGILILYDIIFNNWILFTIYNVLPYLFLYDIYIRVSNKSSSLDYKGIEYDPSEEELEEFKGFYDIYSKDQILFCVMYATNIIEFIEEKDFYTSAEYVFLEPKGIKNYWCWITVDPNMERLVSILVNYLKPGLKSNYFNINDPNNIYFINGEKVVYHCPLKEVLELEDYFIKQMKKPKEKDLLRTGYISVVLEY